MWRLSRPTRDGTVEPNSRDKSLIRVREQLIIAVLTRVSVCKNYDHTNIQIHTHNCPTIDKSRSCMGVVVAAIVATAAVDKVRVSPSIIN